MGVGCLLVIAAILVLYFGAEWSLAASEKIGHSLGLPPLVIGMFLIGFGTSLPELFVSHIASLGGQEPMAIGALIGSNLANMLMILSLGALIIPLSLKDRSILKQLGFHLVLCISLFFLFMRKNLDQLAMFLLVSITISYMVLTFFELRNQNDDEVEPLDGSWPKVLAMFFLGLIFLYAGGELLVQGASKVGISLGVSEYVISSVLVAFGTSFPELVTVIVSAIKKKETELIVGNIIGSNLFNCSLILGSLGIYNVGLATLDVQYELLALLVAAVCLFLISLCRGRFNRFFALLFLGGYISITLKWFSVI